MQVLTEHLRQARSLCNQLEGQRSVLQAQATTQRAAAMEAAAEAELVNKAGTLLYNMGDQLRHLLKDQLEPLCTSALQDIYGPDAGLSIQFSQTDSGRHKARLIASTDSFAGPPDSTSGGSVCEVLSLVLRICLVVLHYPKLAPIIVLDEPLSNLDDERMPALCEFLKTTFDELEKQDMAMQLIVTAHHLTDVLIPYSNHAVEIRMTDGISKPVVLVGGEEVVNPIG